MAYKDKTFNQQKLALERIARLFIEAESNFREYPELSRRYMVLAEKLSTRYKVRLTKEQKGMFCKNCHAYLKNGINLRTRLSNGKKVSTCLECKAVKRMDYRK